MNEGHYTGQQLLGHLTSPNETIARHLGQCHDCQEELALTRELDAALRDSLLWEVVRELRHTFVPPPAALVEAARVLEEDDRAAAELLAPALVSIGAFREHDVEVSRRYRSPGVVRVLTREAKKVRDSSPKFASLLATTAARIAAKLDNDAVRPVVVGAAWLERGIAEAMIGSYRDSEDALRHAEDLFDQVGSRWDLATVWLSRANVFNETDRFGEALQLSSSAAEIFLGEYGDVSRHLRASLVRGTVLYYGRMYRESIAVFEAMLADFTMNDDPVTHARTLHNAANSYLGAGDLDKATTYYLRALALWDQLGADAELARTHWLLASVDVARGDWVQGYEGYRAARRQLAALGLENDEALIRLDMAEVLILMNRTSEVPPLLDGIALRFATEGMTRKARLALACVAEAAQPPSREDVRALRDYLTRLPMSPSEPLFRLKQRRTP